MALIRWEPAAELNTIQREMNRLFNTAFDQPALAARGATVGRQWIPAMDLSEAADHYVLSADLPGMTEDEVNVQVEENMLTISGERRADNEQSSDGYHRIERAFGAFSRSLTLPVDVDPAGVEAQFDRGVLEVRIPKPEQKHPTRVHVKVGSKAPTVSSGSGDVQNASVAVSDRPDAGRQ